MKTRIFLNLSKIFLFVPVLMVFLYFSGSDLRAGNIIFVTRTGSDSGASWDKPSGLQNALKAAVQGTEIWVAKGTYLPTDTKDQNISFQMKKGVSLYGGFEGNETERSQRDWKKNAVILSGDIGEPGEVSDNSYHVILNPVDSGVDKTSVIDGFIITGGYSVKDTLYDAGGGMLNLKSSPVIQNCTFKDNYSGIYNIDSSPDINNCTFRHNLGKGGMVNKNSSPVLNECDFYLNTGMYGGLYNFSNSEITITKCMFRENQAFLKGAGILNMDSMVKVKESTFSGNIAKGGPGGGMFSYRSTVSLSNSKILKNKASSGGGIFSDSSKMDITDCDFIGNITFSGGGGGFSAYNGGSITITKSNFLNNEVTVSIGNGGAISIIDAKLILRQCVIANNSVNIKNTGYGGGLYTGFDSLISNCVFYNNKTLSKKGGAIYNHQGSLNVINSIIYGNLKEAILSVTDLTEKKAELTFSNVQGGYKGDGNIDKDPLFTDPENNNFTLQKGSPCIGTGKDGVNMGINP